MNNRKVSHEETIRRQVRRINELWLNRRYAEIGELLSEEVVLAPPGFKERLHGREAYIQSYRDYDQSAITHRFSTGDPRIDIVNDTAMSVTPFFVQYEVQGKIFRERGHDVLVWSCSTGAWLVGWRTVLVEAAGRDDG